MSEATADHVYDCYARHGVGPDTLLSRAEFREFWEILETTDRDYWAEQIRRGPIGLSKEFLAGFSASDEEALDPTLLKSVGDRLRSLGRLSGTKR